MPILFVSGGGGESRRIKAFKWFSKYFGVPTGAEHTLSCKREFNNLLSLLFD
jgi:hypothetical protein